MSNSRTASRLLVHAALIFFAMPVALSVAVAATPEEAKAQAELAKAQADLTAAQLANAKTMQEMLAANKQATEGKATLENIESGAEALQLRYAVEHKLAVRLAEAVGGPTANHNSLILIFGEKPPTTAHYLSMLHAKEELRLNTIRAIDAAKLVYDKKPPKRVKPPGRNTYSSTTQGNAELGVIPALSTGLTAISTIASMLRVDTEMKGLALATKAESLGPLIARQLASQCWDVRAPSGIARATPFADGIVTTLRPSRNIAADYYAKYLSSLAKAKDGKPENLPEGERIAGAMLDTVIKDYSTLVDALYTPAEGILPATVLEEEKALATAPASQHILFVQAHEGALTSITKKGFLTGIIGIPAYVSASTRASYAMVGDSAPRFGSVTYQTPVMRVTGVAAWAVKASEVAPQPCAAPKATAVALTQPPVPTP